jgi:hypothetical protein
VKVWILSLPPNILGVYSTEEKAEEAKQQLDDDIYLKTDTWIWEVDGAEVEED